MPARGSRPSRGTGARCSRAGHPGRRPTARQKAWRTVPARRGRRPCQPRRRRAWPRRDSGRPLPAARAAAPRARLRSALCPAGQSASSVDGGERTGHTLGPSSFAHRHVTLSSAEGTPADPTATNCPSPRHKRAAAGRPGTKRPHLCVRQPVGQGRLVTRGVERGRLGEAMPRARHDADGQLLRLLQATLVEQQPEKRRGRHLLGGGRQPGRQQVGRAIPARVARSRGQRVDRDTREPGEGR